MNRIESKFDIKIRIGSQFVIAVLFITFYLYCSLIVKL